MYWKGNKVKVEIGLARGKQEHDKRDTEKQRDWQIEKQRTMRSEEHTSELQSLMRISYAVFCLKKKINSKNTIIHVKRDASVIDSKQWNQAGTSNITINRET